MSRPEQDSGSPVFMTDATVTTSLAKITGIAKKRTIITDVSGSSDKAGAKLLVKDGTTVVWQVIIGAGNYAHHFETGLKITAGADASVTVDNTAAGTANISGVTVDDYQ